MIQHGLRVGFIAAMTGGVILLAGCQSEPKANSADAVLANVQGISFNDPLPASDAADEAIEANATGPTAADNASPEAASAGASASAQTITAETSPAEIAAIPSATPMPSPTPDPVVEVAQVDSSAAAGSGDFVPISFKKLSGFKYVEPIPGQAQEDAPETKSADQIPSEIKALDGTKAIVEGWMVPMDVAEDGSVKSFVLVKTQPQCCFGDMQAMNEWVDVTMQPGKNAEFNVDLPMKVYGQLEVGEKKEDGFVLSVYRMKAEKIEL